MRIRNTILYTILCCSLANISYATNYYKIQLGVFVKKIPFTHFAFSGINDICMDTDENNVHRYYLRTTFEEYLIAKRVKDQVVERGFSTASIISFDKRDSKIEQTEVLIKKGESSFSKTIHYDFNQFELTNEAKIKLNDLVQKFKQYENLKVAMIGHTDSKGDATYNVELSKNRIRAVRKYLIGKGVPRNQLITKACGESSPICSNVCEEGRDLPKNRKLNRRVKVFVLNAKGEIIKEVFIGQTVHPVLERVDQKY